MPWDSDNESLFISFISDDCQTVAGVQTNYPSLLSLCRYRSGSNHQVSSVNLCKDMKSYTNTAIWSFDCYVLSQEIIGISFIFVTVVSIRCIKIFLKLFVPKYQIDGALPLAYIMDWHWLWVIKHCPRQRIDDDHQQQQGFCLRCPLEENTWKMRGRKSQFNIFCYSLQ